MDCAPSRRERLLWKSVATYAVAIWVLAYFVQFALDLLRDHGLLSAVVTAFLLLAAVVAVGAAWRLRLSRAEWLVLVAGALVFALVASRLEIVQERIHLVQYGGFATLCYAALAERQARRTGRKRGGVVVVSAAFALTAAVGWIDEGVQYLLPNRVYDLRDVALNAAAGLLAVTFVALGTRVAASNRSR